MGEWTIAVIDVEEALPPSFFQSDAEAKPKPSTSGSEPTPEVPVSEPNGWNRTLPSSLLADTEAKPKPPVPAPEVAVSDPTVWTVASKTESAVSEQRPDDQNAPQPKPTPSSQPKKRYFSDLFTKLSAISTLGRTAKAKPVDPDEIRRDSEPTSPQPVEKASDPPRPEPVEKDTTVQVTTMADVNVTQLEVHPEPTVPDRAIDVKSSEVIQRDTEQDSGTYDDGQDNVSVSSDNTTNSDQLYTDTEDPPTADPESVVPVYDELTEAGNTQAATGDGDSAPATTEQQGDDNKEKKKKKKTPGCTGNLFSCMKKPGSKKKKKTTKNGEPGKGTEEPVQENKEEVRKEEQKEDAEKEDETYEEVTPPVGDNKNS
ncbi:uncharacterized protein LOC144887303 [Branchiostoma floridae x Branchiostoma japonicum]